MINRLVTIYKNSMELRLLFSEGDSKFFTLFAVQLNPIILGPLGYTVCYMFCITL